MEFLAFHSRHRIYLLFKDDIILCIQVTFFEAHTNEHLMQIE